MKIFTSKHRDCTINRARICIRSRFRIHDSSQMRKRHLNKNLKKLNKVKKKLNRQIEAYSSLFR